MFACGCHPMDIRLMVYHRLDTRRNALYWQYLRTSFDPHRVLCVALRYVAERGRGIGFAYVVVAVAAYFAALIVVG